MKKGGFKRIPILYNQSYDKISEHVYQDNGGYIDFNGTVTEYTKRPVPTQLLSLGASDDIERAFLDNIGSFTVDYGAAVDDSLFQFKAKDVWNTNHIMSALNQLCHLHASSPAQVFHFKGITSPYIYYGLPGTSFAIHIEDMALWSCNFNTGPGVKLWYVVPPSHYQILKETLESVLGIDTCEHPLQHKNIFVDPRFFQAHDIPYTRVSCYNLHNQVDQINIDYSITSYINL